MISKIFPGKAEQSWAYYQMTARERGRKEVAFWHGIMQIEHILPFFS